MNILLLGGGGREHALARKISESPLCSQLYIAPGNGGTASAGINVDMKVSDFAAIKSFSLQNDISLIVVGPEDPLVAGIWDYMSADGESAHIRVVGPSAQGALLEGSKDFAKEFMEECHIPTAAYRTFDESSRQAGVDFIRQMNVPIVLKADGLAAGKGVVICQTHEEAVQHYNEMLDGRFGAASSKIVIEQFLSGIEFSVFALTDGNNWVLLPEAKDYKRIGEGDTGPNTGGMGAVTPVPFADQVLMDKVRDRIIQPTVDGIKSREIVYKGLLFFGLIVCDGEPYVIEYNCRFGDPETEVILQRLDHDLVDLFLSLFDGSLGAREVSFAPDQFCTVILASGGYPEHYEKGYPIHIRENIADVTVYHAGTALRDGELVTNGGRVMAITGKGSNIPDAVGKAYTQIESIDFEGKYFRRDIGKDLV